MKKGTRQILNEMVSVIKLAPQTINRYLEKGLLLIRKFKVGIGICLRTFYEVGLKVFQND